MRKTNFTLRSLKWMVMSLAMVAFYSSQVAAQAYCAMACNNDVQISLNGDCEAEITFDMMLEDPWNPNICSPNGSQAFVVTVMDASGDAIPTSPVVTCDWIGHTLPVKVKHWATGNICWGTIVIEDKLAPVLDCPAVEIWCNEPADPGNVVPYPSVSDNCDNYPFPQSCGTITLEYTDELINYGCVPNNGLSARINRTWTATDASGNSSSCVQQIDLLRATLADVEVPPHYDGLPGNQPAFDCESAAAGLLDVGDPAFNYTGYPYMHSPSYWIDGPDSYCEINVIWEDTRIDVCDGSFKILRDWRLVDWCTGEILDYTQIIKVVDETTDIACAAPWMVGTNGGPTSCTWSGNLPGATVNENCSSYEVVTKIYELVPTPPYGLGYTEVLFATLAGNGGTVFGLAIGQHRVVYTVTDDCGNHDECETYVTVEDDDAPTPVCDEHTQVTLDPDCTAIIYAETFDDGSHDNCCVAGDLTFEARRFGSWGSYIEVDGDDCPGPVTVFMRVTDCNGNTSEECMVEVFVDDKTDPIISCPADKEIMCWTDYNDTSLTGEATAIDACGIESITWQNIQVNLNPCGVGFVRRRWRATDVKENSSSCIQRIDIVDNTPISVSFPPNYTAQCTTTGGGGYQGGTDPDDLPAPFNKPNINGDDCELIAVNNFDQYFPISDNVCFKILREWIVIDWCVFDEDGPHDPSNGYYSDVQEIKVIDTAAPVIIGDNVYSTVNGNCFGNLSVCIEGTGCSTTVSIPQPEVDDCAPEDYLTRSVSGDFSSFSTSNVGPGTYHATVRIDDGCNNYTDCDVTIVVTDCKKPTPYCQDVFVEIMQTGMIELWASDFNLGSFDNCPGDLTYSFSANVNNTNRTFDCDDIGSNIVEMWVTDAAGNQDYCEVELVVQDNMGVCDDGDPLIAGTIETEDAEGVFGIDIEINGTTDMGVVVSNDNGAFNLNVPVGNDYTVIPKYDEEPLNGVTTYDLVVMRKHILGTQLLDSPYKLIAADINNSETITTFDMVELRKVILQIEPDFPNNTSWRFVEGAYEFPEATNPWSEDFPEIVNINNLQNAVEDADFVAVKIGDLSGNASTNNLLNSDDRSASQLILSLSVEDQKLTVGETYTVNFTSADFNALGYQFTLNFDQSALDFVSVENGVAKAENFGLSFLSEGAITTSWNGEARSDNLFGLTFVAKKDAQLSDLFNVNSRHTVAEGYNTNNELLDVQLNFTGTEVTTFDLYQNTPNPFKGETIVGFNLPQAGAATLTVNDLSGKTLFMVEGDFSKGYNQVSVSSKDLAATGVLYYTLSTDAETATKKMILIK
ncbi:MAG: T9SS type A sorting domain-containing protein [Bacteroidetes bacterium]|nr:T9SS type A sorting domain-containing protein [Bacteroidota bacterium]